MKVEQISWTIQELVEQKERIELNPAWQRGPAWKVPRQVLLLDSILRGMDIPKIYLRQLSHASYDAVDGQQRLRAILMFHNNQLSMDYTGELPPIDGESINGKHFSALSKKLKDRFEGFKISIGLITHSRPEEIRNLFARLQMGVSLNPAELRNAMEGPLRYSIDSTARLHPFFHSCKISADRYKHLDFAAHAYAMAAYDGKQDIKAPDLRNMISEYGVDRGEEVLQLSAKVDEALDLLAEVNSILSYSITQKWIFVDLAWLLMKLKDEYVNINHKELASKFKEFESLRRKYNSEPENLLSNGDHDDVPDNLAKMLYDYIGAFRAQGGLRANINIRNRALRAFLL